MSNSTRFGWIKKKNPYLPYLMGSLIRFLVKKSQKSELLLGVDPRTVRSNIQRFIVIITTPACSKLWCFFCSYSNIMNAVLLRKGASTLCRVAECNKIRPCHAANSGNNVYVNAVRLRQGFCMLQNAIRHENSIGKMLVSSKVCHVAYNE